MEFIGKKAAVVRLDEQLCFALYAATNAVTRAYRPKLDAIGLTYPQYLLMIVLWEGREVSAGDAAQRLGLAPNAITPLADRLEAKGLIERRRDTGDRRAVRLVITEAGSALEAAAAAAQGEVVCETTLAPEELSALRADLRSLVLRMEARAGDEG